MPGLFNQEPNHPFPFAAVTELFNTLDWRSDGLMIHFAHTFDSLVHKKPDECITILLDDDMVWFSLFGFFTRLALYIWRCRSKEIDWMHGDGGIT